MNLTDAELPNISDQRTLSFEERKNAPRIYLNSSSLLGPSFDEAQSPYLANSSSGKLQVVEKI